MPLHLLIVLTLFLLNVPTEAHAQSGSEDFSIVEEMLKQYTDLTGEDGVSTTLLDDLMANRNPPTLQYSPTNPGPGERVTVSLQRLGTSYNSSLVNWYVDDVLFSSGVGVTKISFSVGNIGSASRVYAELVDSTGMIARSAVVSIGATHVDILWEAMDAKTHPFYKGKALPSWDTIIKSYAIPEIYTNVGQRIPPETFEYTWKKNQSPLDLNEQSGYGKEAVFVLADFTRKQHRVGVELLHADSGTNSSKSTSVKLHDPQILLYEKHPLQGVIFERILPTQVSQPRSNGSLSIATYPFGMDARNRGDVAFTWKLNGRTLSNTGTMHSGEIPLVSSERGGISSIVVEARNEKKPLQTTGGSLRINVQ